MFRILFVLLGFSIAVPVVQAQTGKAVLLNAELGVPFQRYETIDALGRTITFYLSVPPAKSPEKSLPIALWVQGSGCQSVFGKQGDKTTSGMQAILLMEANRRARVLVVEKPGVNFQDAAQRPGTAEGASETFLQEQTLDRWAEANTAALRAAWTLPNIDSSRTLLVGHSEGGIIVARVAAVLPQVTHVASLAGGGPTQLFCFAELDGRARPNDAPGDASSRQQAVFKQWTEILSDPDSTTKFWRAHPYRRWSSFMSSSLIDELMRSKARVYLAHGTEDTSTSITSFDVARCALAVAQKDLTVERVEGADHGLRTAGMPKGSPAGMAKIFTNILAWFLPD